MKERPIIFSTPMVKAILAGRKTQTRRVLKPKAQEYMRNYMNKVLDGTIYNYSFEEELATCPYGKPGDFLWVRETWGHTGHGVWKVSDARMASLNGKVVYRADEDTPGGWFPSIHMPKEFARIFLKITDVRIERLQDISDKDAKSEGMYARSTVGDDPSHPVWTWAPDSPRFDTAKAAFEYLWQVINGPDAWNANPWIYALTFERVEALEKAA